MMTHEISVMRRAAVWLIVAAGLLILAPTPTTTAQTVKPDVSPDISISANGRTAAHSYQGWALVFSASVYHPNLSSRNAMVTPLVINAQNGSWANTAQLMVVDANGVPQNWPVQLVTTPTGPLTLGQTNGGTLTWVLTPSATATIMPGTYQARILLNTTNSAGTSGWNGVTSSYTVSIQINAPPAQPTLQWQEEQAELLARYDSLLGNQTQAVADLDALLTQQPAAIVALAMKGNLLDGMGRTADALVIYDDAIAVFYAANPGVSLEPPVELLQGQGRLRSKLLSQTGQRGTPQANIRVVNHGVQSVGVYFFDLQVTNVGSDVAQNIALNSLAFQPQSGAGQVLFDNVLSHGVPISTGFLGVNASATVRIYVSIEGAVDSFALTENGKTADIFGTASPFSQTQPISGNFTGAGGGTPYPLIITASNETQPYGGPTPKLNNVTYNGFVNGDGPASLTGTPACTTTATSTSPVGNYPINCSGLSSSNYLITFVSGTLNVTPVSLTVSANDASWQYGQANPALTASFGGFTNGDGPGSLTGTLICTSTATASSPVSGSPYLIVCSGLNSNNYTISYLPGQLTLTPAPLTITADNQTREYGQPNPTFTASFSGLAIGETAAVLTGTLTCTTTATPSSPVGSYPINCTGLSSINYIITFVSGTFSVTAVSPTVSGVSPRAIRRQSRRPNLTTELGECKGKRGTIRFCSGIQLTSRRKTACLSRPPLVRSTGSDANAGGSVQATLSKLFRPR